MSASISFPALLDEDILWINRAAAEAFFNALFIPSASPTVEGSVKQALLVNYNPVALVNNDSVTVVADDNLTTVVVPIQASYTELRNSYIALATAFNQLLVNLRNAGILES